MVVITIRCTKRAVSKLAGHKSRHNRYFRLTREISTGQISQYAVERALRYAKATLAIEGQFVTKDAEDIVRRRVEGKMTHEQFKKSALALALKR